MLTYTEIEDVKGTNGDFKVKLRKKPRYIIEDECTGCGTCVEYCPIKIPDPFNQELNMNKAVHIYFSQAIPLISYIDEDNCLYLKENKCGICEAVCENGAIDFTQHEEELEVNVASIIFSTGFEPFDPTLREEYCYGKYQNIVTSMDFERILSSTGPYEGEILRPSDLKHPKKIAWIQCVGSRQVLEGAHSYCSAVCCTYTQKQLMLTKDHYPDVQCTIFHNDIRAYGKDFERYYERAKNLPDVRFIRSYVTITGENPENKNIKIRYSTPNEGVKEEEFEMVVLSVGLTPPKDAKIIAEKFGIELNEHGFCQTENFNLIKTRKPGIFVTGAFQGPVDIPETVFTASGAVSQCGEYLNFRRNKLTEDRVYPPERDVSGEEPRVGIFVCHCGANIGRVVDVPHVVEFCKTLPYVVHAQEQLFSCSTSSAQEITDVIKEKNLNRVIVAACSPRNLEATFKDSLREAGINQYFVDMANIREHCSWVHSKEKEAATEKSKDLIKMSLARALHLEPLQEIELSVNKNVLILGGGVAGMTTALSIAKQGFDVYLVEKEKELGGKANSLYYTIEGFDVQKFLNQLKADVYKHPLIHVYTNATIEEASGYIGNFSTKIKSNGFTKDIIHGATVIATGSVEYKPDEYFYNESENVLTQSELESKIAINEESLSNIESVVMIQCVGCRNEERNYCSRICCSQAVKNAIKLKEINPDMDVYILYRDMRMYGYREDYYRKAAEMNVRFIRYELENKPEVKMESDNFKLYVYEPIIGKNLEIDADLIILSTAVVPSDENIEIAQLFKVGLSPDGFFQEAHVKLRPVDFSSDGVFLCGSAHYPKHIQEVINQAYGAAGRVITLISHDKVTVSGAVCSINEDKCMGCGACVEVCNYDALELVTVKKVKKARVNPVLCKGDGLCNSKCPTGAITIKHYTDEQIINEIDGLFGTIH